MSTFGEKVRELRISKRFSQQYLASRLNMPQTTLSALERGVIEPSFDTVELFANYFGVSPYFLLPYKPDSIDSKSYEIADTVARNEKLLRLFDAVKVLPDSAIDAVIAVAEAMSKGLE